MSHQAYINGFDSNATAPSNNTKEPIQQVYPSFSTAHSNSTAPWVTQPRDIPSSKWLDNNDLRPTPIAHRNWGPWTSYLFWFSAAANLSNWYSPTSFMTQGLTMWEALLCHLGGQFLAGVTMAFSGRPGAVYHVGYPILARASFGWIGAIWPVIQRVVMSIIWNGVNVVQGGQCVYVMLHAIFPSIVKLKNGMAKEDALDTGGMIAMVMFWAVLMITIVFVPIHRLKYFLVTKVPVFAVSAVAMLIWTLLLAKGLPSEVTHSRNGVVLTPSTKKWLLIRFIFLSWANNSTFVVTAADIQRYTTRPNDAIVGQIFGFPVSNFIVGLVGVIVGATSIRVISPENSKSPKPHLVWNPIVYLDKIQTQNYTPANRAGAFLLAFCFAYCGLFSCIVENLLPAGNDLSALWPKYLTIKRCLLICTVLAYACVPWKLLGTATHFISWLSSYQIFLSAIAGILLCHYYMVSGGLLLIEPDCYSTSKSSVYNYFHGLNPRAYIAYILGVAPNFYGFLGQLGLKISQPATRYFYFAYPIGLFVSFTSYFLLNIYFPPRFSTVTFYPKTPKIEKQTVHLDQPLDENVKNVENFDNGEHFDFPYTPFVRRPFLRGRQKFLGIIPKFRLNWKEPYDYISPSDPSLIQLAQQIHYYQNGDNYIHLTRNQNHNHQQLNSQRIVSGPCYDMTVVKQLVPQHGWLGFFKRNRHSNKNKRRHLDMEEDSVFGKSSRIGKSQF